MNQNDLRRWYDLTGQTAVITGGTGVLGREMASALVGCGANVVLLSRSLAISDELQKALAVGPGKYMLAQADVLDRAALEAASQEIRATYGTIDILVNAAGGNHSQATTGVDLSFFDLPEEALSYVFELNLLGTILPAQVFGRIMAHKGAGVILNVTSMSAFKPLTRIAGYSAAKAAVSNFTQWLAVHMAQEYSPQIRVNAIAPGFFLTDQNRFLLTEEGGGLTTRGQHIISHTPMGRFGEPGDLIGAVLWLLSPASSFVTGIVLPIDGGFSAYSGV